MSANLNLGWCCNLEVFWQCSITYASIVASYYFCIKHGNFFYVIFLKEIPHSDVLQNTVTGFGGSLFSSLVSHNIGMKEAFSNLLVKNPEYIYNRFSFYNDDRH